MARAAIKKSLRFAIFTRDGFACRYCGQQPPAVKLVIDHIVPVVGGGGNDEENLITSCDGCNSGKGAKPLGSTAPNETDAIRRAQEHREQVDMADLAQRAVEARKNLKQTLVNYWCDAYGIKAVPIATVTRLVRLSDEFGVDRVLPWIDTAALNVSEYHGIKYVNGIARNVREQGGL